MSATPAHVCTAQTALVQGRISARTLAGSMVGRSNEQTSANTGVAPVQATALAVATKGQRSHDDLVADADASTVKTGWRAAVYDDAWTA